ncbi:MAG: cupin domain-containing protein [Hydrogenophaga sp.]|nr:cupin domain-containing protein [Hydrogenophaga sp.]
MTQTLGASSHYHFHLQMTSIHDSVHTNADPLLGLGLRVKHARLVQGQTLKQLSELAGCSESMLSKIERGIAMPSLSALHRLAIALHSNVAVLTATGNEGQSPIGRAGARPVVEFKSGRSQKGNIRLERLLVPVRGQLLQADIHILEPRTSSGEQIAHVGEELGYVLDGELELTLESVTYKLQAGDHFAFASDMPHSYRNPGKTVTRVLWVNTPPTF